MNFSDVNKDYDEQLKRINELEKNLLEFVKNWERQETELKKYPLYNKILSELEQKEAELKKIKFQFNKLHHTINNIDFQKPKTKRKYYSLECDYSAFKIKDMLFPLFEKLFICNENQIVNLLSENITTQIITKPNFKLKDVVYFLDWLKRNNHIKTSQLPKNIGDTKCVIWNNKPLTSRQITKTINVLKTSLPSEKITDILD